MGNREPEVRQLLDTLQADASIATADHFIRTYGDLRRLAEALLRREAPGPTLQATALVNEAYMRLVGGKEVDWRNQRRSPARGSRGR